VRHCHCDVTGSFVLCVSFWTVSHLGLVSSWSPAHILTVNMDSHCVASLPLNTADMRSQWHVNSSHVFFSSCKTESMAESMGMAKSGYKAILVVPWWPTHYAQHLQPCRDGQYIDIIVYRDIGSQR